MTAKEMFKELGYSEMPLVGIRDYEITYLKGTTSYGTEIIFDTNDKTVVKYSFDELDYFVRSVEEITLKELQAINKQVEELGW